MSQLFFSPLAEQDLLEILEYIEKQRPQAARKWYHRLCESCALLAKNPELGELRPDLATTVRSFVVKRWVIYYRIESKAIVIVRVLDAARDVRSLD